ncbi:EAL domain-containing protein [uncultured Gammaproteobacteria bacterium]
MSMSPGRPSGHERARMTGQDKSSLPHASERKLDHDNEKLLMLLRAAKAELHGLRLIHLHLSLLRDRDPNAQNIVRTIIGEMAGKGGYFQSFNISNSDVIILYKGLKLSSVTEVCLQLERLFLARTSLRGPNPYRETSLYSVMELSLNFVNVLRFLEALDRLEEGGPSVEETKPAITLEELSKLERSMGIFDLSPFMFSQPIVNVGVRSLDEIEYYELYISIKQLQDRLCPNFDLAANRWLFNYFTANLDQSVLRALIHSLKTMRERRIGININLPSVISTGFVKFDDYVPFDLRNNITLEISKGDLVESLGLFEEVVEYAADKKYKIGIDGLNLFWAMSFDLEGLQCHYAKIFWSNEFLGMKPDFRAAFAERMGRQQRCRFILARCDSIDALVFAKDIGITLVQGRAVDNILRKGVKVSEAIAAAKGGLVG